MRYSTVFLSVLALSLGSLFSTEPTALNLFSNHSGATGPAYWTMTISGNQISDTWEFTHANLSWEEGTNTYTANVMTDLLAAQTFVSGNGSSNTVNFVHEMPEEVLEFETVDLTLSVNLLVSSNTVVGPVVGTSTSVDILSRRERYWDRFESGGTTTVASFSAGSSIAVDYTGTGLYGYLGIATNMGIVEVTLDGNVINSALDLFPDDLETPTNVGSSPDTRYEKIELVPSSTFTENGSHRVEITLLDQRNASASSNTTGLSVTGFAYEFLLSDNARINEFEIDASHSSIKLFSSPTVFDGNVMLQQVGFSTNTFSGNLGESIEVVVTPTNPVVDSSSDNTLSGNATTSDNTTTSDNVTTGTNTGTVDTTTTDTTTTDTTVTDTTVAKPRLKTRIKTLAEVSADHVYVFSLESPNLKESFLWEDLNNREITFDDADEIHRLTLKWIDDLGQVGGSFEQYYVPLSQPSTWAIGDDSIELSAAGFTLTLTREDSSEAWEVGVVKGNALIDAEQNTILVVQKSGGSERLSFSMTGSSGASAVSAESSSVSATGITLDKANLVVLGAPVSTSSVDSDVVSTSGSSSSSGGGGGGGCLLR